MSLQEGILLVISLGSLWCVWNLCKGKRNQANVSNIENSKVHIKQSTSPSAKPDEEK